MAVRSAAFGQDVATMMLALMDGGRGRPRRIPGEQVRRFCLRLSESELVRLRAAARRNMQTPTEFIRVVVNYAATESGGEEVVQLRRRRRLMRAA